MEGDAVNQWIDAVELRKLADSLMIPGPKVTRATPEVIYGESFVGYTEVQTYSAGDSSSAGRDAALKTLSEARGTASSAGIVYRQPVSPTPPVEEELVEPVTEPVQLEPVALRASDEMAAADPVPQAASVEIASPFRITKPAPEVSQPPARSSAEPEAEAQFEVESAPIDVRPTIQVIASAASPSGQPLSRRMAVFGDWLKASVPAEAFFVCDRNGEIISDEIGNEKLVKVARTLAHASSSASRQVGDAGGLASPHVKIGADRILQVIPKRSKFGLVVLGVIIPKPLQKDEVAAIANSLSKTLGDEVSIPI